MMRLPLCLSALALASCNAPKIECDSEGMIIIPDGIDTKTSIEWTRRNTKLALDRLDEATGFAARMPEHLVKAQGCP